MPNAPRRQFLSWDRPLLSQAVAFLTEGWSGGAPLDLSRLLIVVPTRQSGRRLRESLAAHAAQFGSAVFPPRVLTPEGLIASAAGSDRASRLESLLAWAETFRSINLDGFREVFPQDPPERSFAWALRLAEQFVRLQTVLGENALRIVDVPAKLGSDFSEADRWRQLALLEQRQAAYLSGAGLRRKGAAADSWANSEALAGIERIVLLAAVDPLPAAIALLAMVPAPVRLESVVFAPAELADHFDPWGRALADKWAGREVELAAFQQRVHLCADPAEQAARLAALAAAYGGREDATTRVATAQSPDLQGSGSSPAKGSGDGVLALGIADPEVSGLAAAEAARAGVAMFNPDGVKRSGMALYHLLTALVDCATDPTFDAIERLVRCPDYLAYLGTTCGNAFSTAGFLAQLDGLRKNHLPPDLASARPHATGRLADGLAVVADTCAALGKAGFPENLATVLGLIFTGRRLRLSEGGDAALRDAAEAWMAVLRECAEAAKHFPAARERDWWGVALRLFGETRHVEEKPAQAIDLQGWLELIYEDAPHLVVAGLNDGFVPEAIVGDAFLPESLRARLGLRTNVDRFARDAYLLQALAASRSRDGRLDLLFGKTSTAGEPLRPSRLLLRCADSELPARIEFLFRTPEAAGAHLPWTRAWQLTPRLVPAPPKVAVTSLRRWLACPFRFYLKVALRMEAVDAEKRELDAFDFGLLCHAALEAMGKEPALRDCTDARVIRDFLLERLDHDAKGRLGSQLSLPLVIQLESARQRLGKLAELQARERAAGWVIQTVERPFTVDLGGVTVSGKIDRIDRSEITGAVRILDYKTSDLGIAPAVAHLRTVRKDEQLPDWVKVMAAGKLRAWSDLQLPLYRHALTAEWGDATECGYINLPKAISQTAVVIWDDCRGELQASALRCAEGVCAAIRDGSFWPPSEDIRPESDEFAALFHRGAAASVNWRPAGESERNEKSRAGGC